MATFFINKEARISMSIEVEAESEEEALSMVENAWENNEVFIANYYDNAFTDDIETYSGAPLDCCIPFDEMVCEHACAY